MRALDTGFDRLWQKDFCAAGPAHHKLDTDSDGLAEALFLGKYKIDAQGNTLCTLPIGNDHADGLQVGDIIPTREGFELAEVGESGGGECIPRQTAPGSGAPRSPTLRPLRSATSNSGPQRPRGGDAAKAERAKPDDPHLRRRREPDQKHAPVETVLGLSRVNQSTNVAAQPRRAWGPEEILGGGGTVFNPNGIVINNDWFTADGYRLRADRSGTYSGTLVRRSSLAIATAS